MKSYIRNPSSCNFPQRITEFHWKNTPRARIRTDEQPTLHPEPSLVPSNLPPGPHNTTDRISERVEREGEGTSGYAGWRGRRARGRRRGTGRSGEARAWGRRRGGSRDRSRAPGASRRRPSARTARPGRPGGPAGGARGAPPRRLRGPRRRGRGGGAGRAAASPLLRRSRGVLLGLEWRSPAATETKTHPPKGEEAIGAEVEREGAVPAVGLRSNGLDQFRALRTRSVQRGLSDRRSHMRQLGQLQETPYIFFIVRNRDFDRKISSNIFFKVVIQM